MHFAPERLFQLQRRNHVAGMSQKQTQRSQFLGGQVDHRLAAPQRAIGLQPESCKGAARLLTLAVKRCRR